MTTTPTAIITGANSGIGEATARAFAASGHRVALVARRGDAPSTALAKELGDATADADLTDRSAVTVLATALADDLGEIDVVVNAAGSRPDRLLTSQPFDEAAALFDEQLTANLLTFNLSYALAPLVRRPGGRIINIGSIAAQTGGSRAGSAGYAAAKAAVHGLTLGLSRELAPEGITVNRLPLGSLQVLGSPGTGPTMSWPASSTPHPRARPGIPTT